jgi:hypothetical protein
MRKVRYNDRLWFGKYKGQRACDVLHNDTSYIQKLQKEHGIVFDKEILDYFEPHEKEQSRRIKKTAEALYYIHVEPPYIEPPLSTLDDDNMY